ncbi:MAG: hypothetical protein E7379_01110 [Clostridiales bacterium]|nr:hypothetical protein [Clostridiales bacterium]
MKRLIAFIFVVCCMVMGQSGESVKLDFDNIQKVVLVSSCEIEGREFFMSGNDYYTTINQDYAGIFQQIDAIDGIKGVNIYFDKSTKLSYFKDKLDFISGDSEIEGNKVYQGYTHKYKKFNWIDGKKENCQLVQTNDCWILGFPLVLTGF